MCELALYVLCAGRITNAEYVAAINLMASALSPVAVRTLLALVQWSMQALGWPHLS